MLKITAKKGNRVLASQRYQQRLENAKSLAENASNRPPEGLNLVFPAYIYQQVLKAVR